MGCRHHDILLPAGRLSPLAATYQIWFTFRPIFLLLRLLGQGNDERETRSWIRSDPQIHGGRYSSVGDRSCPPPLDLHGGQIDESLLRPGQSSPPIPRHARAPASIRSSCELWFAVFLIGRFHSGLRAKPRIVRRDRLTDWKTRFSSGSAAYRIRRAAGSLTTGCGSSDASVGPCATESGMIYDLTSSLRVDNRPHCSLASFRLVSRLCRLTAPSSTRQCTRGTRTVRLMGIVFLPLFRASSGAAGISARCL